jgi:hypothetical protein
MELLFFTETGIHQRPLCGFEVNRRGRFGDIWYGEEQNELTPFALPRSVDAHSERIRDHEHDSR